MGSPRPFQVHLFAVSCFRIHHKHRNAGAYSRFGREGRSHLDLGKVQRLHRHARWSHERLGKISRGECFSIRSPWIRIKFPRPPQRKFFSPSSGTCRLLCPPARMARGLLPRLISPFISPTLTKLSLGCSNVPQVRVHPMIGPLNYSMPQFSKHSHQLGLTSTTTLDGFSYEMLRMSSRDLFPRPRSHALSVPSFPSARRTPIPTSQKIS